jgi:hypothetical protein
MARNMELGYVKLWRSLETHDVVGIKTGYMAPFMSLVMRAAHRDGFRGLSRGEVRISRRTLAQDWGVTERFVRTFIKVLTEERMLKVSVDEAAQNTSKNDPQNVPKRGRKSSVYLVVNYDEYQGTPQEVAHETTHKVAQNTVESGPPTRISKKVQEKVLPLTPSHGEGEHPALPMIADADRANGVDPATPLQADPQPKIKVAAETKPKRQTKPLAAPTGEARVAVEKWNAIATAKGLDQVTFVNKTVEGHINARLQEVGGIDGWDRVLKIVEQSPFLLGKIPARTPGQKPFRATLSWVTGPQNFAKVMNGAYIDAKAKAASAAPTKKYVDYVLPAHVQGYDDPNDPVC